MCWTAWRRGWTCSTAASRCRCAAPHTVPLRVRGCRAAAPQTALAPVISGEPGCMARRGITVPGCRAAAPRPSAFWRARLHNKGRHHKDWSTRACCARVRGGSRFGHSSSCMTPARLSTPLPPTGQRWRLCPELPPGPTRAWAARGGAPAQPRHRCGGAGVHGFRTQDWLNLQMCLLMPSDAQDVVWPPCPCSPRC